MEELAAAEEAEAEAEFDAVLRSDAEFDGSESEWTQLGLQRQVQMAMDAIARHRAGLAKWQERRQAMLEVLPIECIYRIAESRGGLRQTLLHHPEHRHRCGCRKNIRGQCTDDCERSSLHLFNVLNGSGMHFVPCLLYMSVSLDEAAGDLVYDETFLDDGWNGMSTIAAVDYMIREMHELAVAGCEMPPHLDESLWLMLGEQKVAVLEKQRQWRKREHAAGRNGLTARERQERTEKMRRATDLWNAISCFANPLCPTSAEVASINERTPWRFRVSGHRPLLQIQFSWRRKLFWMSELHSCLRLKLLCKILFVRNNWNSPKHMHNVSRRSGETMHRMVLGL